MQNKANFVQCNYHQVVVLIKLIIEIILALLLGIFQPHHLKSAQTLGQILLNQSKIQDTDHSWSNSGQPCLGATGTRRPWCRNRRWPSRPRRPRGTGSSRRCTSSTSSSCQPATILRQWPGIQTILKGLVCIFFSLDIDKQVHKNQNNVQNIYLAEIHGILRQYDNKMFCFGTWKTKESLTCVIHRPSYFLILKSEYLATCRFN